MEAISISLWVAAHPYLNYPLGRLSLSYDVFGSLGGSGGGGGSIQNPHARLLGSIIEVDGKAEEEVVEEIVIGKTIAFFRITDSKLRSIRIKSTRARGKGGKEKVKLSA